MSDPNLRDLMVDDLVTGRRPLGSRGGAMMDAWNAEDASFRFTWIARTLATMAENARSVFDVAQIERTLKVLAAAKAACLVPNAEITGG